MGFKRVPYNQTWVHEENGLGGKISGFNDAVFLRNTYQSELDNANAALVNMVHHLEEESKRLKGYFNAAPGIKKNIEALQQERHDLYSSLDNLLKNETNFEKEMWKTTQEGQKANTINIRQKFKDSDVDEMRYDSMLQYLKKYPEYASKSSYTDLQKRIADKEREIVKEKKRYHEAVSNFNFNLSLFQKNIQKAKDKFAAYDRIFTEGSQKIKQCRYYNSLFYRYASEKTKAMVNIDNLSHRVDQFRHTLEIIENELSQYEGKKFVEMEY